MCFTSKYPQNRFDRGLNWKIQGMSTLDFQGFHADEYTFKT